MLTKTQQELKLSLLKAIEKWLFESDITLAYNTDLGDLTCELMAESAFNILIAQQSLTNHYNEEERIKLSGM